MRALVLLALIFLSACSHPDRYLGAAPAEVDAEPVYEEACPPGGDDGIGGTGCKID